MKLQLKSLLLLSLTSSLVHGRPVGYRWAGYTWDGQAAGGSRTDAQSNFTMVFMSDPQFMWGCGSEENNSNDYCGVPSNYAKDRDTQAQETNRLHIATIKAISTSVPSFAGVVINGDLTRFGSQDGNLDVFKRHYMNMGLTVWPGLGNHDYENNVNDCGAAGWANRNYCGAEMVQFLANFARSSDHVVRNDITKYSKNTAQAQDQRNVSGSLAYSWDVGKFHFVQLNNYPTYTKKFTRGYKVGISSWDINITSPEAWLRADLRALPPDRRIILNWHKYGDIYDDTTQKSKAEKAKLIAMLAPYAGSIKAIFVGHFHGTFGQTTMLTFPAVTTPIAPIPTRPGSPVRPAIDVPVIYSGSAIFNRFIKADFDTRNGCTITTTVINTSSGSPVPARNSNRGDGVYTIQC